MEETTTDGGARKKRRQVPAADKRKAHDALRQTRRNQHGLFTQGQARDAGLTRHDVYGMVGRGEVGRFTRGVFRDLAHPSTNEQRLMGNVLALGPRAFATSRSACHLYKADGVRVGTPHVGVPHGAPHRKVDAVVHQMAGLEARDIRLVDNIPCVSPEIALLTVAADISDELLEDVLVDLSCRRVTSPERVMKVLDRLGRSGRNGTVALRNVAGRWQGERLPGSVKALQLGRLLVTQGLPEPEYEIAVLTEDGEKRVDGGWPQWMIGFEYNSDRHHLTWERRRSDARRMQYLEIVGWGILPATQDDINDDAARLARAVKMRVAQRAA